MNGPGSIVSGPMNGPGSFGFWTNKWPRFYWFVDQLMAQVLLVSGPMNGPGSIGLLTNE
jgi:hypothetical protein